MNSNVIFGSVLSLRVSSFIIHFTNSVFIKKAFKNGSNNQYSKRGEILAHLDFKNKICKSFCQRAQHVKGLINFSNISQNYIKPVHYLFSSFIYSLFIHLLGDEKDAIFYF